VTRRRTQLAWALVLGAICLAGTCARRANLPDDPLLDSDLLAPQSDRVAEIVPGAHWIDLGPDGKYATADDEVRNWIGDTDLVVRTGMTAFSGPFPPALPAALAPLATSEPFGLGLPIHFVVAPSSWAKAGEVGDPVTSPSVEGKPVVVVAFADLDGDGYVGVTELDGDPADTEIEESELEPVGRRLAFFSGGQAGGALSVSAGGPSGTSLSLVVGASAYAGDLDPTFFGGQVPDGPAVMSELPFLPRTDPQRVIDTGPAGPSPADPDGLLAVQIEPSFTPDPADPIVSESFSLATDGSRVTLGTARSHSGTFARVGLGLLADPAHYRSLPGRPLRPGRDDSGSRVLYEILQRLHVPDDGPASQVHVRLLPLDRLGNVADLAAPQSVALRVSGGVRITAPDVDGDPQSELLSVPSDGIDLSLDDLGTAFDDVDEGQLIVEASSGLYRVDLLLPDPDLDDSGLVDGNDLVTVVTLSGTRLGDPAYQARADLDGDGVIGSKDQKIVASFFGLTVPVP